MTGIDLPEIRRRTLELAKLISAPASTLPTFGYSEDGARPHVEASPVMAYAVVERGRELFRETFVDVDLLLFRIFEDVTFEMASDFELHNRRVGEDSRRQLFAKQLEYLGTLNPDWRELELAKLQKVLSAHPFDDALPDRDRM